MDTAYADRTNNRWELHTYSEGSRVTVKTAPLDEEGLASLYRYCNQHRYKLVAIRIV